MANYVRIEGDKELQALFKQMPDVAKVEANIRLKEAAVDALGDMVRQAPVDTGNLRDNIKFEELPDGGAEVSSRAYNEQGGDYAPLVEFGTRYNKAQPYFWNNVRRAQVTLEKQFKAILNRISK